MAPCKKTKGMSHVEIFSVIFLVFVLAATVVAYLLIGGYFSNYAKQNINSEAKYCETFETTPLFGQIRCSGQKVQSDPVG